MPELSKSELLLITVAASYFVPFCSPPATKAKRMLLSLTQTTAHIAIALALNQIDIVGEHMGSAQSSVHEHAQTLPGFAGLCAVYTPSQCVWLLICMIMSDWLLGGKQKCYHN